MCYNVLQCVTIILISRTINTVGCPLSHSANLYGFEQNVVKKIHMSHSELKICKSLKVK
jgi:hypothetical protein